MKSRSATVSLFIASAVAGCAFQASPIPDERKDAFQYVLIAPVPLAQAVVAAEEYTVGKAISAGLVRHSGKMQYQVLLTAQGRLHTVTVDPVTGAVLQVTP